MQGHVMTVCTLNGFSDEITQANWFSMALQRQSWKILNKMHACCGPLSHPWLGDGLLSRSHRLLLQCEHAVNRHIILP